MQNRLIEHAVEALYAPGMPYHNFRHAIEVAQAGDRIVSRCMDEGVRIDGQVVYFACLFHDAGYHEVHESKGFTSKVAYPAHLARECLSRHGFADDIIEQVNDAILSTHCDGCCTSNEAKAVRAADLSGLSAPYREFKRSAVRLREGDAMLNGKETPWEEWRGKAGKRIELFLREELNLTRDYYDADGKSVFHLQVRENIRRLLSDPSAVI